MPVFTTILHHLATSYLALSPPRLPISLEDWINREPPQALPPRPREWAAAWSFLLQQLSLSAALLPALSSEPREGAWPVSASGCKSQIRQPCPALSSQPLRLINCQGYISACRGWEITWKGSQEGVVWGGGGFVSLWTQPGWLRPTPVNHSKSRTLRNEHIPDPQAARITAYHQCLWGWCWRLSTLEQEDGSRPHPSPRCTLGATFPLGGLLWPWRSGD